MSHPGLGFSMERGQTIEIYKENRERIDIVILNMIMPDMSGSDMRFTKKWPRNSQRRRSRNPKSLTQAQSRNALETVFSNSLASLRLYVI